VLEPLLRLGGQIVVLARPYDQVILLHTDSALNVFGALSAFLCKLQPLKTEAGLLLQTLGLEGCRQFDSCIRRTTLALVSQQAESHASPTSGKRVEIITAYIAE
jgi:hypothetical protein